MTRLLTKKEIEYIIDFIKPQTGIPLDTAMSVVNSNKQRYRRQLKGQKTYPELIPSIKEDIKEQYFSSLVPAGESIGVVAGQSIGQIQTQMTLNTFHKAGQSEKGVTAGVPRFQELLNATKDPKIVNCKVFFREKHKTLQDTRTTVGHSIVGLTLADVTLSMTCCINKEPETWYEAFKIMFNDLFSEFTDCISIKMNIDKMFHHKLTMKDIADYIHSEFEDLRCVYSPPSYGQLDIFVDTTNIDLPSDRLLFIDTDNASEIYLEECVQPALEKITVCGIAGVSEIYYIRDNGEWIIETDGSDFQKIMAHPSVDYTRTISNNVWDIYETLGIEASRQFLIEEFMGIMEGINECHTKLLVDRMTNSGTISSISRYTLRKGGGGPMGRASFEETMDNFLNAAAHGDIEPTKGVSASIICGKRANIGTGMMDITMDLSQLPDAVPTETHIVYDNKKDYKKRSKTRKKVILDVKGVESDGEIPTFVEI
jgi:DNA-directed RNA polymerase beta' subunit